MSVLKKKIMAGVAAAALLTVACPFEPPGNGTGEPPAGFTTPAGVLELIEQSYNERDIEKYKSALKRDVFVFYFNPADVGETVNGYVIPQSWTYTEDTSATKNMFEKAYDVDLLIFTENIPKPEPGATEFYITQVHIDLKVMENESKGYRAYYGYCNFKFVNTGTSEEPHWLLTTWWDFTRDQP